MQPPPLKAWNSGPVCNLARHSICMISKCKGNVKNISDWISINHKRAKCNQVHKLSLNWQNKTTMSTTVIWWVKRQWQMIRRLRECDKYYHIRSTLIKTSARLPVPHSNKALWVRMAMGIFSMEQMFYTIWKLWIERVTIRANRKARQICEIRALRSKIWITSFFSSSRKKTLWQTRL